MTPSQIIDAVEPYAPDYAVPLVASLRARTLRLRGWVRGCSAAEAYRHAVAAAAHLQLRRDVLHTSEQREAQGTRSRAEHFAVGALVNCDGAPPAASAASWCAVALLREVAKKSATAP